MRESSRQGYSGLWTSTAITRKYTPATLAHMEDNTEMRMKRTEWSTCMYLVRKTSRFALRVEFTARYASSRRIIYIIYIYEANRGTCNQEPHRHALGQQPGRHMHENIAYLCTWYVRVLAMYIYCYTYVCLQACDYKAIVTIMSHHGHRVCWMSMGGKSSLNTQQAAARNMWLNWKQTCYYRQLLAGPKNPSPSKRNIRAGRITPELSQTTASKHWSPHSVRVGINDLSYWKHWSPHRVRVRVRTTIFHAESRIV